MKIGIVGAGAWGSGLAIALCEKHRVTLWARDGASAAAIGAERCNTRYLPGVPIPEGVLVRPGSGANFGEQDMLLVATPTAALREVLEKVRAAKFAGPVIWACKGFEQASAKLPHEVAAEVLGARAPSGALSGPSFALEVARGLPAALTLAARDADFAKRIARELHQPTLRVYYSTDVVGVELSGAVKNVMAIAAGISDGLGLGLNARAALITRGLAELARLGTAVGGKAERLGGDAIEVEVGEGAGADEEDVGGVDLDEVVLVPVLRDVAHDRGFRIPGAVCARPKRHQGRDGGRDTRRDAVHCGIRQRDAGG